jgi:hypothetical protein
MVHIESRGFSLLANGNEGMWSTRGGAYRLVVRWVEDF